VGGNYAWNYVGMGEGYKKRKGGGDSEGKKVELKTKKKIFSRTISERGSRRHGNKRRKKDPGIGQRESSSDQSFGKIKKQELLHGRELSLRSTGPNKGKHQKALRLSEKDQRRGRCFRKGSKTWEKKGSFQTGRGGGGGARDWERKHHC